MNNIRLVEERKRTRQMLGEASEWLYYFAVTLLIVLVITLPACAHAWASRGL